MVTKIILSIVLALILGALGFYFGMIIGANSEFLIRTIDGYEGGGVIGGIVGIIAGLGLGLFLTRSKK